MDEASNSTLGIEEYTQPPQHFEDFYRASVFESDNPWALTRERFVEALAAPELREYYLREDDSDEYFGRTIRNVKEESPTLSERYWSLHTDAYRKRVDGLADQANLVITEQTKAVVVLAAMNERDLKRALDALRASYGDTFEEEITVLIYNNYKTDTASNEARSSVAEAQTYKNVKVVHEHVPAYSNVCFAKKVATDIAMRAMGRSSRQVPLVMTDADIIGLNAGAIQDALSVLADPESRALAVTTDYDFDAEAKRRFPNWGFVEDFRVYLTHAPESVDNIINLKGPFYVINPPTLIALGGIYPFAVHEDMELSRRMRELLGGYKPGRDPIYSLASKHGSGSVVLDPSRQIENLIEGRAADAHWGNRRELHSAISGTRRLDWREIGHVEGSPELMETFDPAEALWLLYGAWIEIYGFGDPEQVERNSNILARFLSERGIDTHFDGYKRITDKDSGTSHLVEVTGVTNDQVLHPEEGAVYQIEKMYLPGT